MRTTAPAGSAAVDYFALLRDTYAHASSDERRLELSVADRRIRVRFGSPALEGALRGPLERLVVDPADSGAPGAAVRVWDSASTGTAIPPFPWHPEDVHADGRVEGFDGGRFRCQYRDNAEGFHAVAMFDTAARTGYVWFADHARIHWYERAEPLRSAIHWALAAEQRFLAHASAVGDDRGAVVLTGPGGAGKTTTTLAALLAGLRFVSDNYVVLALDEEDRAPVVYGLYGGAKLWSETLDRLPELRPFVERFDVAADEKLIVDVARHRPDRLASGLPVRAVVVPSVVGSGPTHLARCSAVDTLLALAPATILQLPRNDGRRVGGGLSGMAELVRRVPRYRLVLGSDPADGPLALRQLLDTLGG